MFGFSCRNSVKIKSNIILLWWRFSQSFLGIQKVLMSFCINLFELTDSLVLLTVLCPHMFAIQFLPIFPLTLSFYQSDYSLKKRQNTYGKFSLEVTQWYSEKICLNYFKWLAGKFCMEEKEDEKLTELCFCKNLCWKGRKILFVSWQKVYKVSGWKEKVEKVSKSQNAHQFSCAKQIKLTIFFQYQKTFLRQKTWFLSFL